MTMKLRFFPILLVLLTSCVSNRTRETFNRAESVITETPDSALAIVKAIDSDDLKTRSSQARHALLLSMAQYKSGLRVVEDSTIRVACNYYQKHGSSLDRLKSSFLLGVVLQNSGNDIGAVIAFREAEPLAEALGEYRWQSLCDQHLCTLYSNNYDRLSAMTYAKKSLEAAEKVGEPLMVDYCRLDIASQYHAQKQYDQAEELYSQLMAENDHNAYLYSYAARFLAKQKLFGRKPAYDKADSLYSAVLEKGVLPLSSEDYVYLGLISERKGERDVSEQYCRLSEQAIKSQIDSDVFYLNRARILELRGNNEEALLSFKKALDIENRIFYAQLEQSIAHAMEEHYFNQSNQEKEKGRLQLYLALLIGVLLSGVVAWLMDRLYRAKKAILEQMAQIHDFSCDLEKLQSKNTVFRSLLDHYVKDKIRSLNSLADTFFSWDSDYVRQKERNVGSHTKEELVETFQKQLETFRKSPEFYSALENVLNVSHDNIMVRAREEMKHEKKVDFDLVSLFFAGFPAKSICFLKNMTEASVRMRKTRLKLYFASLPNHRGDEFVKILERKDNSYSLLGL